MYNKDAFVLSAFMEELEEGFYTFFPNFDELEREFLEEERELAKRLSEFGIDYTVPFQELDTEEFQERLKEALRDPIVYENNINKVLVKDKGVSIEFSYPGSQKRYWANFMKDEIADLPFELQRKLLTINSYIFPYLDKFMVQVEGIIFFRSKGKIYVKFVLSSGEVVYSLEDNKEILSYIKDKFDLTMEVEEAWGKFKLQLSQVSEAKRAVRKAQGIRRKESGISDWYQYSIKFSDKIFYIFKPRLSRSGEVYYSVFKIQRGDPAMGIPDKVEGLFALSTDKFLKEWEDLLERRK